MYHQSPAVCLLRGVQVILLLCLVLYIFLGQLTTVPRTEIATGDEQVSVNVNRTRNIETLPASRTKTILIWNGRTKIELDVFGNGREIFDHCPIRDCFITRNKSFQLLEDFDAVIINIPTFARFHFPSNGPRRREQRYVFFSQEAPAYMGEDPAKFNGFFNWTMTYQTNSDVPYTYGRVVPLKTAPVDANQTVEYMRQAGRQGPNYATGKTKLVAWFTSHCYTQSRREKYVSLLRKYVKVDIYGGCYMMNCSLNLTSYLSTPQCYDLLEQDYKFYLSFENALCTDYVTEKFFDILNRRIVPVVLGGVNYSQIAPPHSYIDASQYSPKELAAYLRLLATNDRLYNEYFWWKPHYRVEERYPVMATEALCHLCQKLHVNKSVSIYADMKSHFGKEFRCHKPVFPGVRLLWGFI